MSRSQVSQIPFAETETCGELQRACLAAERALRQYRKAAEICEQVHLHVIAHAFAFTAAQEKEHAAIFGGLLEVYGGETPEIRGEQDSLTGEIAALLENVARQEEQAGCIGCLASARIAEREGYPRIAMAFARIAETERLHARRFRQYAAALGDGSLFRDPARVGWLCLPCGQLHYGTDAPEVCAACGCARSFIRSSFHPFAVDARNLSENCIPPATVI